MKYLLYTIWLIFPKLKLGIEFSINPLTGFGLLDPIVEHASAKDLQQRSADVDREMWEKSTAHDIDMFNRESEFASAQMQRQYDLNIKSLRDSPGALMHGLKSAGLNPILAATGGFRTQAPNVNALGASTKSSSPSRGSGASGAKSNIALAHKMGKLVESEANLNTARAEAERARAGITGTKDTMLQFAKSLLDMANEALKALRDSGYFGETKKNVDSVLDNIKLLTQDKGIEITEHTRRQLIKMENKLKAYKGRTGGRNRRNKQ